MKKFLTFLITLVFSLIVFNDNVKAEVIEHEFIDTNTNLEYSFSYDLDTETYPYYFLLLRHFKTSSYDYYTYVFYATDVIPTSSDTSSYNTIYFTSKKIFYELSYKDYNNPSETSNTSSGTSSSYSYYPDNLINAIENNNFLTSNYLVPVYTNFDFISKNDSSVIMTKDYINNNNGYNTTPTINITQEAENEITLNNGNSVILNKELNINFSSFNTNNYKYLYSYDTENWYEITENDYTFLVNKNNTLYVQITDLEDNYITSATYTISVITENILDYSIEDGTEKGKKLTIYYYNFDTTDYHIVSNFQTGTEKKYNSELMGTIVYDNISLDNTFSINSYDKDDNFIVGKVIDIQVEEAKLNNNRYIQLNLDKENKRLNFYYVNYKKNDKCYYKISSEDEKEVNCNDSMILDITKNGYIEIYIKNDEKIVLKRGVNVNFIDDLPIFKFESYYNDTESKQVLKVIVDNLESNDKIYYSYDKETWTELENKRINTLDFYVSTEIYFKVERNSEIVSEAYFDLVYNSYENSSSNNNQNNETGLKGILKIFKELTKFLSTSPIEHGINAYNAIRNSKFGLYIFLVIVSSIIILILKSIKR